MPNNLSALGSTLQTVYPPLPTEQVGNPPSASTPSEDALQTMSNISNILSLNANTSLNGELEILRVVGCWKAKESNTMKWVCEYMWQMYWSCPLVAHKLNCSAASGSVLLGTSCPQALLE